MNTLRQNLIAIKDLYQAQPAPVRGWWWPRPKEDPTGSLCIEGVIAAVLNGSAISPNGYYGDKIQAMRKSPEYAAIHAASGLSSATHIYELNSDAAHVVVVIDKAIAAAGEVY